MKIDFLNVWHWDCTVVQFDDRVMMVDINNWENLDEKSLNEIFSDLKISSTDYIIKKTLEGTNFSQKDFLQKNGYNINLTNPLDWISNNSINHIFRFVCTHPDMDHISWLKALKDSDIIISNFWDVDHNFTKEESEFEWWKYKYEDWQAYEYFRNKNNPNPRTLNLLRWNKWDFWDHDNIFILSPTQELIDKSHEKDEANHLSHVLLIEYFDNVKYKIYLCGDATDEETLPDLIEYYWEDFFKKWENEIVILKAPHHGRDSWYHQPFVKLLDPDYVIVSVGKKPSTDASNKYKNHCDNVWSTRWYGNITIDLKNWEYLFEHPRD